MRIEQAIGQFGRNAREMLTGKLTPERRQEIIDELESNESVTRFVLSTSSLLNPGKGVAEKRALEQFQLSDLQVVMGRQPFEIASDRGLKHMLDLKRNADKMAKG